MKTSFANTSRFGKESPFEPETFSINASRRSFAGFVVTGISILMMGQRLALAQTDGKIYRVGVLSNWGTGPFIDTLKSELAKLGYVEGKNVVFEARFPEGKLERLPGFAASWLPWTSMLSRPMGDRRPRPRARPRTGFPSWPLSSLIPWG